MIQKQKHTCILNKGNSPEQIIGTTVSKGITPLNCIAGYIKKRTLEGKSVCLNPTDIP